MDLKNLDQLVALARKKPKRRIAVTSAADINVLKAVLYAVRLGLIHPLLIGPSDVIIQLAGEIGLKPEMYEIIDEPDPALTCTKAVALVKHGHAEILMKGLVPSSVYLKAILNKETGLENNGLLSHFALVQTSYYKKLVGLADVAINIKPGIEDKIRIIRNSVDIMHKLGNPLPKVALLSAVEIVNPKIVSTTDAEYIRNQNRAGNINGCIIDGPLSVDIAISSEAAAHKGVRSDVAGDADILVVPDLDSGNIIYKTLLFLSDAKAAAIVAGAGVPIVLTSRADTDRDKLFSIALASALG